MYGEETLRAKSETGNCIMVTDLESKVPGSIM